MTVTDADGAATTGPASPARPARRRGAKREPRTATPAPAARVEPGRVAEPRHRNPTWLVAGVLLVVVSALGGVVLFTSADRRSDALVAASELAPGRPLQPADLRIERVAVGGDVATLAPSAAADLVGRHPVGRVPAGTLLSAGMFAVDAPLGADEVVVGAALDPGEAPVSAMDVGADVELLRVDPPDATSAGQDPTATPTAATSIGTGVVWAVEPVATGQLWVSLRVPRAVGLAASDAATADALRVVLIGGRG